MSWLDSVPVSTDVYVFQAALICEDCGKQVIQALKKKGITDTGDSDDFPQGPYGDGGGETDTTQFCDRMHDCVNRVHIAGASTFSGKHTIGCPLGNPLTSAGAEDLRRQLVEEILSPEEFMRHIGRLNHRVWKDYTEPEDTLVKLSLKEIPATLPKSLHKHISSWLRAPLSHNAKVLPSIGIMLLDSENVYLIGQRGSELQLIRSAIDDDGEFGNFETVSMPAAVGDGYDGEKLLRDAITDLAWD